MRLKTQEFTDYIISEYISGKSSKKISQDLLTNHNIRYSESSINYKLKKNNIKKRTIEDALTKKISDDYLIIQYTKYNKSCKEISDLIIKNFNIVLSSSAIRIRLIKNNIKLKNSSNYNLLSNLKQKEVCKLYKENESIDSLSNKFNCGTETIRRILIKNNIPRRSNKLNLSLEQEKEIIDLYTIHKFSMLKISKIYECTDSFIAKVLKKNNIPLRNHLLKKQETIEFIIKLYTEKRTSIKSISKKYNCSHLTIKNILKENNIAIKDISDYKLFEESEIKEIIKLYTEEKHSTTTIARKFKCNEETIRNYLKRNSIERINNSSNSEFIIEKLLLDNNIKYIKKTRKVISPLELDFYLPEYNIALEINGIYWHSSQFKTKKYHYNKYIKCKEQGITLLQFWEDDLNNKFDIIKSMILARCNKSENKLDARKCYIKEVSFSEIKSFCNENHIQGQPASNNKGFGLFFEDKLISLISYTLKDEIIITRFCSLINHNVRGGFSKLFSKLKQFNKSIKTYSSNDISNGNLYLNNGFECINETIDMYYTDNISIFNRQKFMKHKLKIKDGFVFDENLTENENMILNNFYQLWKSGIKTWYYK